MVFTLTSDGSSPGWRFGVRASFIILF